MSDKIHFDDYIVTSIEEEEFIRKDFRKAVMIIALAVISALATTYILYII